MSADFTPSLNTYTDLTPFRFWCQKILPIAYDDSLSYYELLCKVVDYLNKTMEDVELSIEDVEKLHDAYAELQTYVNTYFANLDVQEEINNKLDALVADGTIHDIFNDDVMAILTQAQAATQQAINNIPTVVGTWLGQHVTQETGYVIDDSLSTPNAAADALATGVADSNIKSAVELAFFGEIEDDDFVQGYRTQEDYYTVHNQTTRCTSAKYYHVYPGDTISISNIADGTKSAILGAGKTSATNYDSGWKTDDFTYTAVNELIVLIEAAKSDDTADILVSDVTTVFTLVDKSTRITDNENAIGELKSDLSEDTWNIVETLPTSVDVRGVTVESLKPGFINITGTATSGGGRTVPITKAAELQPGQYTFQTSAVLPSTMSAMVQIVSANTILATLNSNTSAVTFTVSDVTNVYIGINLTNGASYNITGLILQIKSGAAGDVVPRLTTTDYIARNGVANLENRTDVIEALIDDISLDVYTTFKDRFPFMVGGFTSGGEVSTNTKNRLISAEEYYTNVPIYVNMPSGYKYGVMIYAGGGRQDSGWLTGEYIIPADSTFRLQLARSTEISGEVITDIENCDLYVALTFEPYDEIITAYDHVIPVSTVQIPVQYPWTQGACLVGRKLVGFNASADDHLTYGTVRIYDVDNNLTQIGSFAHNTGHASTADYCERTDTMSVANGTYADGVVPTIYLVKNATAKITAGTDILITDPNVIAFDVSNLTGQGVGACFGETDQFMYVLTVENAAQYDQYPTKYIYKLLMGKGANDMTSLFASNNFGTFISGCGDNEYNGTAHLVAFYSLEVYGELQGLKYRNGFLYMSCDTSKLDSVKTPYLAKIKLTADAAELVEFYHIPNYSDTGSMIAAESEGFIFDGAVGYVTVFPSGNTARTLKFNAII